MVCESITHAGPTCSVVGCGRRRQSNGLCGTHLWRQRNHGDVGADAPVRALMRGPRACSVAGCEMVINVGAMCSAHRRRLNLFGDARAGAPIVRIRRDYPPTCSIDGCNGETHSRGFCKLHYSRWYSSGNPGEVDRRVKPKGQHRGIDPNCYVRVSRPTGGGYILEHRLVMERILGRSLFPKERVHHKNGNRADNNPGNLELWTVDHPPGQRVSDQVAWARQLLATYPEIK